MGPNRISLWSGPRHVSSALLYAFAQRPDTHVIDEPFYGYYLRMTGAQHPGRDEILATMPTKGEHIIAACTRPLPPGQTLFIKNMSHHMVGLPLSWLDSFQHVMLIRPPEEVIPSLLPFLPSPNLLDTGYRMQYELYQHLVSRGQDVLVIHARNLQVAPRKTLQLICDYAGVEFSEAMLRWQPGLIPHAGVWAKHWYGHLQESSGFMPYRPKPAALPSQLEPLLETCQYYYYQLLEHAVQPFQAPVPTTKALVA